MEVVKPGAPFDGLRPGGRLNKETLRRGPAQGFFVKGDGV